MNISTASTARKAEVRFITIRLNGAERSFQGRYAWTLARLIEAGKTGCTPVEQPAPRWAHYVFWLRREGVDIETVTEKHGGAYAGTHARYVLRSPVEVIQTREAA